MALCSLSSHTTVQLINDEIYHHIIFIAFSQFCHLLSSPVLCSGLLHRQPSLLVLWIISANKQAQYRPIVDWFDHSFKCDMGALLQLFDHSVLSVYGNLLDKISFVYIKGSLSFCYRPVHNDKILSFPSQILVLQHYLLLWQLGISCSKYMMLISSIKLIHDSLSLIN